MARWFFACLVLTAIAACETAPARIELPKLETQRDAATSEPAGFRCQSEDSKGCDGTTRLSCVRTGEFLEVVRQECGDQGEVCDVKRGCVVCQPGIRRCVPCAVGDATCTSDLVEVCDDETLTWSRLEVCDLTEGQVCFDARCQSACEVARAERSYVGCEFYAVDLDNAALDDAHDASSQQFAVAVANPHRVPITVVVDQNDAPFGAPPEVAQVVSKRVPPGDLEVFALPRREVDGSSAAGLNDGTHTAVSSNAYRVVASHPVSAYQFNPLENVNVFSNDASLLLPTSALGGEYTVVGWPQTIGHSDDPDKDFDSTSSDEDLRAFLTIVGTEASTRVEIDLGASVVEVVGAGPIPPAGPLDTLSLEIGPFDVINLETAGFSSDFTGSVVRATRPVAVFVGSEASDVPTFGTYATRRCCADHLEEQLLPDGSAGTTFVIARMPSRTAALNAAAAEGMSLGVAEVDEPEWVRVVATGAGETVITTTLPPPDDMHVINARMDVMLRADRDFVLQADRPVAVLQAMASQEVSGIPSVLPGGDPSIVVVPPVEQFRADYIFLTPDKYAFDFVTIAARPGARLFLDGEPLPDSCTESPIEVPDALAKQPGFAFVVHRCQLAFPIVRGGRPPRIEAGVQRDGVHTLVADDDIGIVVFGFDRFVSYAYAGGMNLDVLN